MRPVSPFGWRSRKAASSGASSELAWWRRQGTIARRPSTLRSMRRSTVLTGAASLVVEQRQDVAFRELPPAVQEAELDHEGQPDDLGPEALDQADRGGGRPAGRQDVVDHEHPLVEGDRVAVQLEETRAVLQLVGLGLDFPWQLADLADRHEAGTQPVGHRRGDDEPASLDPDDLADALPLELPGDALDDEGEALRVGQEGRDVLEDHPGLGKVRDVPDQVFESRNVRLHNTRVPAAGSRSVTACDASASDGERRWRRDAGWAPRGAPPWPGARPRPPRPRRRACRGPGRSLRRRSRPIRH